VFVGGVPLLERVCRSDTSGHAEWQPRSVSEINCDLSRRYGLPVQFDRKIDGLRAAAEALDRDDLIYAQIATLHLEVPDPPPRLESARASEILNLVRQLQVSGLLKADWDPAKHPRWPAGSPDSVGGRFAPADSATGDSEAAGSSAPIIPAQITIPAPFDFPVPPLPSEIVPPPAIPDIYPRELTNPYPDRAGCDEEWADAIAFCKALLERNQLGRGDYRGSGKSLYQCIMGQVSERCGGNSTGA